MAFEPVIFKKSKQVFSITVFRQRFGQLLQLFLINEAHPIGDLFGAANLHSLALLNRFDKHRGMQQRVVCSGVEPSESAPQNLDRETALFKIGPVEVGNLKLAAWRRLETGGH